MSQENLNQNQNFTTLSINGTSTGTTSSNTNVAGCKKSRKFMVTAWKKVDFWFDEKSMQYACMCDDKCEDGKYHLHYYVYFKNPRTWSSLKKYFGNDAHIEIPYSNSGAINYITGKGNHSEFKTNIQEKGKMPCDNGQHITVRDALSMTNEQIMDLDMKDAINVEKIKNLYDDGIEIEDWKKEVKVTFITGPSGIGKTEKVKEIIRNEKEKYGTKAHIVKYESTFYHGVGNGKGIAIYDDFRDSHMKASEFINFIDYNVHKMNIKGGSQTNNFNRIFITSVQHPEEIYANMADEPRKQWLRRIEIINLHPKENLDENLKNYF